MRTFVTSSICSNIVYMYFPRLMVVITRFLYHLADVKKTHCFSHSHASLALYFVANFLDFFLRCCFFSETNII